LLHTAEKRRGAETNLNIRDLAWFGERESWY
jgi:hypothetical protein